MKHLYIIEATSLHDTLITCAHIYGRKEAEEEKEISGERITDYNRI